jgi:hypothetical protein
MGFRWGNLRKKTTWKCGWEDNTKTELQEVGWETRNGLDSFGSGKGQVEGKEQVDGTCKCGNEPSGSIKFKALLD